jgi:hypothetical protein
MPRNRALSARGRLNALKRYRPADDPVVLDADRDLRTEGLAEHVHRVVNVFPPLSAEQRDKIAALLRGAPEHGAGDSVR